jgi:tetratricopeptide (TPR) repeat protein
LAISEKSYGTEHPMVAIRLNNLAALTYATNRLAEAEPLLRRALAIAENSYGQEHPDVAIKLNNLAQLLQATNRLADAEPLERRAVLILLKSTRAAGHELPNLRMFYGNYQALLTAQKLKPSALAERLNSLGPEAGYTAEEWAAVQAAWEQVRVAGVVPGSQAEGLGLQPGDVISRYAGEKITRTARLIELTSQIKTPANPLTILRAGKAINLTAQPGKLGVRLE